MDANNEGKPCGRPQKSVGGGGYDDVSVLPLQVQELQSHEKNTSPLEISNLGKLLSLGLVSSFLIPPWGLLDVSTRCWFCGVTCLQK